MTGHESKSAQTSEASEPLVEQQALAAPTAQQLRHERREARRWWIKLLIQPLLVVGASALLLAGLGLSQKLGWISGGSIAGSSQNAGMGAEPVRYICPMMCTPPQSEPGRCPVCAMELVPATADSDGGDSHSVEIDAAARRVADIRTVAVKSMATSRTIRAIGELSYDEGTLKTISAYVGGRIEQLYADYTGMVVQEGDHLALIYSPRLYSGQVEYLLAKKNYGNGGSPTLKRIVPSGGDLQASARQRLIEYGMTEDQIADLERAGEANSRLHVCAPISGTVIEKMAAEGDYVKEGQPIYRLADLSTVWLMLELFPDDAAGIRYGQKVEATVQSLPGKRFAGRIAFIDPNVDPVTRTVGVRVVVPNPSGLLRVGDYAKATINTPLGTAIDESTQLYDPELADKWISPRHPHVVQSAPGSCPVCGVDLVPASDFGFTADAGAMQQTLMVPRDAVLMAGDNSVVYVEGEGGRFEIRRVTVGPTSGELIAIFDGLEEDEQVAVRGNFLIDSQMQLAGNPSLIDPSKLKPRDSDDVLSPEVIEALARLSDEDRALAQKQGTCPVADMPLGSMGTPEKIDVNGTPVFICCGGCRESLLKSPDKYLAKLAKNGAGEASQEFQSMDLPPMDVPEIQLVEPDISPDAGDADGAGSPSPSDEMSPPPAESQQDVYKEVLR